MSEAQKGQIVTQVTKAKATGVGVCWCVKTKKFDGCDFVSSSVFSAFNFAAPVIRHLHAVQFSDDDLSRHTTQIEFLLKKLAQLQSFQLTPDNWMEFLSLVEFPRDHGQAAGSRTSQESKANQREHACAEGCPANPGA